MKEKRSNLIVIFTALISVTLMVVELKGETIYFAQFGNGEGLRSEIVLTNPSDSNTALAVRGGSTFSELRWYPPVEAAKGSLSWVFRAKQPESVRTGP